MPKQLFFSSSRFFANQVGNYLRYQGFTLAKTVFFLFAVYYVTPSHGVDTLNLRPPSLLCSGSWVPSRAESVHSTALIEFQVTSLFLPRFPVYLFF